MEPTVVTDRESFHAAAGDAPAGARVPVEVRFAVADPFTAYRHAREGPGGFFLETGGGREGWGYFGVEPAERLTVSPHASTREGDTPPSLAALAGLVESESLVRGDCTVPYPCGVVGWLSYDIAREIESFERADPEPFPRLEVGRYETIAAWEEPREGETTLRICACPVADEPGAYERGRERALALARATREGDAGVAEPPVTGPVHFESDATRAAFAARVRRVREYIRDGETFQANISQRLTAPAAVHPVSVFAALREENPAPYAGLLEFPAVDLVSASPELLVEIDGDRLVTEPIAGTRPRGKTPEEDDALETDLRTDEKERAEHAMLVDLERNDLGKVSEYDSVAVTEYRRVDRYAEVMHLVSQVEGTRRGDADLAAVLAAVFPGGTITGAPKPRTMEIIDELEPTHRGPYTGGIGMFGFDGRAVLNILIRTLVREGDAYSLRVGAGIVHDSDPEREFEETLDKARAVVNAMDRAVTGRHLEVGK